MTAEKQIHFSFVFSVPSVKILGDKEVYVKSGSSVSLRCLISNCLEEPSYVFWYFGGNYRILDDSDRIPSELQTTTTTTTASTTSESSSKRKNTKKKKKVKMVMLSKYLDKIRRNKTMSEDEKIHSVFARGGIRIRTRVLREDGSAISKLTILNPSPEHSGRYSCRPANLEPAFVKLHIIQGKNWPFFR